MRRGKEIAQGSHASMAWLAKRVMKYLAGARHVDSALLCDLPLSDAEREWLGRPFTKICLQVDSEAALRAVYDAAVAAGLVADLIVDNGQTEFNGVPTPTCCAIGPDVVPLIDSVTGHLKLY